jgi:hypothetical protein
MHNGRMDKEGKDLGVKKEDKVQSGWKLLQHS